MVLDNDWPAIHWRESAKSLRGFDGFNSSLHCRLGQILMLLRTLVIVLIALTLEYWRRSPVKHQIVDMFDFTVRGILEDLTGLNPVDETRHPNREKANK